MNKLIVIFEHILRLFVIILYVDQFANKRNKLIEKFNTKLKKVIIFIIIYKIVDIEFNLQNMCFYVHLYKQLCDVNVRDQAFIRCRRLKNFNKIIYVYDYYINDIICSQIITQKLEKCISNTIAYLNNNMLNFKAEIKTNSCVLYDNRLISMNNAKVTDLKLTFAKSSNIVLWLLKQKRESTIQMK